MYDCVLDIVLKRDYERVRSVATYTTKDQLRYILVVPATYTATTTAYMYRHTRIFVFSGSVSGLAHLDKHHVSTAIGVRHEAPGSE